MRRPIFLMVESERKKHARKHAKDKAAAEAKAKDERQKILAGEDII